jgi:hypothetical protein
MLLADAMAIIGLLVFWCQHAVLFEAPGARGIEV